MSVQADNPVERLSDSADSDFIACQDRLLPGVSRTFALTIPQLPGRLRIAVANAYLLCRIADTVEDDDAIDHDEKSRLQSVFLEVVSGEADPKTFVEPFLHQISPRTPAAEKELIEHTGDVVALTRSFSTAEQEAIQRCLAIMCTGMSDFARRRSRRGLPVSADLDRYCYVVAGCVGEMLTELFCEYSPEIAVHRTRMMALAGSFGQGLQMTNILKDIWDDWEHGACWLPRDVFALRGLDVSDLSAERGTPAFAQSIDALVGVARGHLGRALEYTQLLPRSETGIRRFCLWAIGLAVLTLRNIHRRPNFASGQEVKVSRRSLRATIATLNALAGNDRGLSLIFAMATRGLPRSGTSPEADDDGMSRAES